MARHGKKDVDPACLFIDQLVVGPHIRMIMVAVADEETMCDIAVRIG